MSGADAPDRLTDARLLLQLLRFDPDTHRLEAVWGQWPGIQVVSDEGERVAFFTLKSIRRRSSELEARLEELTYMPPTPGKT